MKRAVIAGLVGLLAACQGGAGDDYPPRPGGGGPVIIGAGGGGGTVGDAGGSGDGDAGIQLSGRACVLADMRLLAKCNATGAGGLKVTLGTGIATTNPDGTFTMVAPLGAGFTWHVTGANFVTSVMPFGTDNTIPVLSDVSYMELLEGNGNLSQDERHGSAVVRVVHGSLPAVGVTATLSPLADSQTFYDSDPGAVKDPTVWNTNHTGPDGVVWVPGVPLPGPVNLTLSTTDGQTTVTGASVESQSITFVTQSLP